MIVETPTCAADTKLLAALTECRDQAAERVEALDQRLRDLTVEPGEQVQVPRDIISLTRDIELTGRLHEELGQLLDDHKRGDAKGNWIREWLFERDLIHEYADTIGNWGRHKALPLALRTEYKIHELRTHGIRMAREMQQHTGTVNERLRGRDLLGAIETQLEEQSILAAADKIERILDGQAISAEAERIARTFAG